MSVDNCKEGTAFNSELKKCVKCAAGTYQNDIEQKTCKACTPAGYITLTSGANSATQCVCKYTVLLCLLLLAWQILRDYATFFVQLLSVRPLNFRQMFTSV